MNGPDTCGCCEPATAPAPEPVANRPGLSAIDYRVGRYGSFLASMLTAAAQRPALRPWTARTPDDYGIALLAMWAYVGDVLTFYQERLANEAYLRTAVREPSLRRLAALIGYAPHPAVAATTALALTVEPGADVPLQDGLATQSVPGPGEQPQTFETAEGVTAIEGLNAVRVLPVPVKVEPLRHGSDGALLRPRAAASIAAAVGPGDALVVATKAGVEEKVVTALDAPLGRPRLSWSPPVQHADGGTHIARQGRVFQLFGHDAPERYLEPTLDAASGLVTWTERKLDFALGSGDELFLDRLVDDLGPGARILVMHGGTPAPATVAAASAARRQVGTDGKLPAREAVVTRLKLSAALPAIADLRSVLVHELLDPAIQLWDRDYPAALAGDTAYALLSELAALAVPRRVLLDDGLRQPESATVAAAVRVDADGDGEDDHLALTFTPRLGRRLATSGAVLLGNVVGATHGSTVAEEVLGGGDAAALFQRFTLARAPLTFVPGAGAPGGVRSKLQVTVGGVRWHEVETLLGYGGDEHVYAIDTDAEGRATVRFGDGRSGARLPTGRDNVVARYRHGSGRSGNVRPDTLTIPLTQPVGLRAVRNPAPATGGTPAEAPDRVRQNAPNTVRTFGRIVALQDAEDAARQFPGVGKARASLRAEGEEEVVVLVGAGAGGAPLPADVRDRLRADLDARRDPNRRLSVEPHVPVPVEVEATIAVAEDREPERVRAAAHAALVGFLAFEAVEFGAAVHLSAVYRVLQDVDGVDSVDVDRLQETAAGVRTVTATRSAEHANPPALAATQELDVSDGERTLTIALRLPAAVAPGPVPLATVAPLLEAALRAAAPAVPAFAEASVAAVGPSLVVVPGGTAPAGPLRFADAGSDPAATTLGLTAAVAVTRSGRHRTDPSPGAAAGLVATLDGVQRTVTLSPAPGAGAVRLDVVAAALEAGLRAAGFTGATVVLAGRRLSVIPGPGRSGPFTFAEAADGTTAAALRLSPASRALEDRLPLAPNELAVIADPEADAVVRLEGAS